MGLKEKKAIRTVEEWLPHDAQSLEGITGTRIASEVDFDSFWGDKSRLMALGMESARGVVPEESVTAFQKMIESDGDMAKEAIGEANRQGRCSRLGRQSIRNPRERVSRPCELRRLYRV
jgi:hypothetical protein